MSETTGWPHAKWPVFLLRFTFPLPVFSVMKATQTTERGLTTTLHACVCVCMCVWGQPWENTICCFSFYVIWTCLPPTDVYVYMTQSHRGGSGGTYDRHDLWHLHETLNMTKGSHDQRTSGFAALWSTRHLHKEAWGYSFVISFFVFEQHTPTVRVKNGIV